MALGGSGPLGSHDKEVKEVSKGRKSLWPFVSSIFNGNSRACQP